MARNPYFSEGYRNEQILYEDLVIESIKIYGVDCYYIPRSIVHRDMLLNEDTISRFEDALEIELYVENADGFGGDGELLSKFGLEIRDTATFVVARRRWLQSVAKSNKKNLEPSEGDLIYFPWSKSFFEIKFVESKKPFYQLKNINVWRMQCELFEYNNQSMNTGIAEIDKLELTNASSVIYDVVGSITSLKIGEALIQGTTIGYLGEKINPTKIKVVSLSTPEGFINGEVTSVESDITFNITDSRVNQELFSQNDILQTAADAILNFDENNPFGDP